MVPRCPNLEDVTFSDDSASTLRASECIATATPENIDMRWNADSTKPWALPPTRKGMKSSPTTNDYETDFDGDSFEKSTGSEDARICDEHRHLNWIFVWKNASTLYPPHTYP